MCIIWQKENKFRTAVTLPFRPPINTNINLSIVTRKPVFGLSEQVRHKQILTIQKVARGLKSQMKKEEGLYYSCSENEGADQLRRNSKADLCICFRICLKSVSHDAAQLMSDILQVCGCLSLSEKTLFAL